MFCNCMACYAETTQYMIFKSQSVGLPNQIAAEEKAEDEHKDGSPKHDNVDIEGEVLKPYIRHSETVVLEIQGHGYPVGREKREKKKALEAMFTLQS